MLFKISLRRSQRAAQHHRLAKQIHKLGYPKSEGYCRGLETVYAYMFLKGKKEEFQRWITSLPQVPKAFLETVALSQSPNRIRVQPFLFKSIKFQAETPEKIQDAVNGEGHGIVRVFNDAIIKTKAEMIEYFNELARIIREEKSTNHAVFELASCRHAIALTLNDAGDRWELFDSNQLPFVPVEPHDIGVEVASALLTAKYSGSPSVKKKALILGIASLLEKFTACSVQIISLQTNPSLEKLKLKLAEFQSKQKITATIAKRETRFGDSLAHVAAKQQLPTILEALARQGANINQVNKDGIRPIDYAALSGNTTILRGLFTNKANTHPLKLGKFTPLMRVSQTGHAEATALFLAEYQKNTPDRINETDSEHNTALYYAAKSGWLEVVKLLLNQGADPSIRNRHEETPFSVACRYNHPEIADLIAQKLVSMRKRDILTLIDRKNRAPIHHAVRHGHEKIIPILARYGVDLTQLCNHHHPLFLAIQSGMPKIVRALVDAKVKINFIAKEGNHESTPAHLAVLFKQITVLRYFAEIDLNFTKKTALSQGSAISHALENKEWAMAARMLMHVSPSKLSPEGQEQVLQNRDALQNAYLAEKWFAPVEKKANALVMLLGLVPANKSLTT